MANLENISLDTRTFPEICSGLTKREWVEMQGDLMTALRRSAQCIYNWKKGVRVPSSAMERVKVSNYLNKRFTLNTRHWFLFPDTI
jgi:hypothetical protein